MKRAGRTERPEPVLLLDENISGAKVHRLLTDAGIRAELFFDHLATEATDEQVIAKASQLGAIVVSRDRDFRYHPGTLEALKASQAMVIWVVAKEAGRPEVLAALLIRARSRISAFAAESSPPALARLDGTAKLTKERLR